LLRFCLLVESVQPPIFQWSFLEGRCKISLDHEGESRQAEKWHEQIDVQEQKTDSHDPLAQLLGYVQHETTSRIAFEQARSHGYPRNPNHDGSVNG
jgi:hypothetical protein